MKEDSKTSAPKQNQPPSFKPEAIELIVTGKTPRTLFEENYAKTNLLTAKYALACVLIEDERFDNPQFLLDNFILPEHEIPEEYQQAPEKYKTLAKSLKEQLHFKLIQKGVLPPNSMDKETGEKMFEEELSRRENLCDLIQADWPIEVVGQIMTVDSFANVSDAKKIEEYRAWATHSLLREYLGVLKGKKQKAELSLLEIIDRLPKSVFKNPAGVKCHLVENYVETLLMKTVTEKGPNEGFATIDTLIEQSVIPEKKQFFQELRQRFIEIAASDLKGGFNKTINIKEQLKIFPSFEQRAFCYYATQINPATNFPYATRLLTASTGLGKTGAIYLALENSNCEKALIIAPAPGKSTWKLEEEKLFQKSGNVFIVDGSADIANAIKADKKYTIVSQELLGLADHNANLTRQLQEMINQLGIDSAAIDEIDNLSNKNAISTQTTIKLLEQIRDNYAIKTQQPKSRMPIFGLTATPIKSGLADLNVPMYLLYPDQYALSSQEATKNKKTFSDSCLRRPDLAYTKLIGEKSMFRWEQAPGVQTFQYEVVPVPVYPFEEYLYGCIVNEIDTNALNKIRLLEDCLLNPFLVKAEVRHLLKKPLVFDIDETLQTLTNILAEWKKLRGIQSPQAPADYLNADRLVELGFGDLVLTCFLSELLEKGVDTLVEEFTKNTDNPQLQELGRFWQKREISTKYGVLKTMIDEALQWKTTATGELSREKVFVVSPARKQGRTGDVLQRQIQLPNGETKELHLPYELDVINDSILIKYLEKWVKANDPTAEVLLIDGSVSVGKARDAVINRWVNDPGCVVLLTTLEASYQSRDFTLTKIVDGQGRCIAGVKMILLSPPWYYQQLKQISGRSERQGQLIPVEDQILESVDTVEKGKAEFVFLTELISRMALSGIPLTQEEQAFFDSKRIGNKIPLQSREARFWHEVFNFVHGLGEESLDQYLSQTSPLQEEVTNAQLLAEKYFDQGRDEYKISGYNAELVANLIKNFVQPTDNILSIGAGTLLLQRKLKKGIDNVDINPYMMQVGLRLAAQYGGRTITARASRLSEELFLTGKYQAVDIAFVLPWTKKGRERAEILAQMNRVSAEGAVNIITVPQNHLTPERLALWMDTLEKHFGFLVEKDFTGASWGKSRTGLTKRLGWCLVARKVGTVNLEGLNYDNLNFESEQDEWISRPKKKKNGQDYVFPKQYPDPTLKLNFDYYEIVNDKNEKTVISQLKPTDQSKQTPTTPVEIDDTVFLKGETREDYLTYRKNLLKPLMQENNYSWEEAETIAIQIYTELKKRHKHITDRQAMYNLILKQSRRSQTLFNNGEVAK